MLIGTTSRAQVRALQSAGALIMSTPMTWASFEAALTGADGAPAALDALTVLCLPEVRETFARVRADEAAPLLEEATASEPAQRGPKLAAALEILDRELEVYLPLTTAQARTLWAGRIPEEPETDGPETDGPETDMGDVARAALVAALIGTELGIGLDGIRRYLLIATSAREAHDAEQRHVLAKEVHRQEFSASSQVLVQVFQMATKSTKQPRSRLRFGRRS